MANSRRNPTTPKEQSEMELSKRINQLEVESILSKLDLIKLRIQRLERRLLENEFRKSCQAETYPRNGGKQLANQ